MLELKDKLGPINWQLTPTKQLDLADVEAFLRLLPRTSTAARSATRSRCATRASARPSSSPWPASTASPSCSPAIANIPQIADPTAPFVYARIMGTSEGEAAGYAEAELDRWAERAKHLGGRRDAGRAADR